MKKGNSQEVMEVENTVSPNTLFGAPKDFPANDCPVFRWKTAAAPRGICIAQVCAFRRAIRAVESVYDMLVALRGVSLRTSV